MDTYFIKVVSKSRCGVAKGNDLANSSNSVFFKDFLCFSK